MKVRNGFVSNSSSASFVVVWPCEPQSQDDVRTILYGGASVKNDMSARVWRDTQKQRLDPNFRLRALWYIIDLCRRSKEAEMETMLRGATKNTNQPIYFYNYMTDSKEEGAQYFEHEPNQLIMCLKFPYTSLPE
jgi:hypothetical protein